ncbi:PQQ-dependent sugar dehydrogenase [Granulosicoccus sp.]|nr:PQQ-dependent sugar dehydrogenase [Granulosicoccus sp.]MDB4222771.1 PQQ-dependent sugar dehydrogenase [Granulosicoccus sp.]
MRVITIGSGEGFEQAGYEQPVTFWDPSIAPSGLALVTSDNYPEWNGNLMAGSIELAKSYWIQCIIVRQARYTCSNGNAFSPQ